MDMEMNLKFHQILKKVNKKKKEILILAEVFLKEILNIFKREKIRTMAMEMDLMCHSHGWMKLKG